MSEQASQSGARALSSELQARLVEEVCDRFEADWKAGRRPRIEDFLNPALRSVHAALLPELLSVELAYRRRGGERPSAAEYRQRFPSHGKVIRDVWQHLAEPGRTAAPGTVAGGQAKTMSAKPSPTMHPSGDPNLELLGTGAEQEDPPSFLEVELLPAVSTLPDIPGYQILGKLGEGGMGVVYKARQVELNRLVALKMIRSERGGAEEVARFRVEAEAVARLQHPNIVQIFEVGEHEGQPFFSLEFVEGGSLESQLKGTPWAADPGAQLVEVLARAVQAAHECGIIHRDLKPANVLLSREGMPKVTDFGLAKRLDVEVGQTQTGMIMGTPSYMAPEQAAGRKAIGPAADVYALGAILYELLTGRPPFRAATVLETLEQVRSQEPMPPRRLQPRTPRDVETICLKCLQKESHQRYGSAAELADDLQAFLEHRPIQARPVGRTERAFKWARRHPAQAAAYALVVLVLALGGVGGTMAQLWRRAEVAFEQADKDRGIAEDARHQAIRAQQQLAVALGEEQKAKDQAKAAEKESRLLMYLRAVDLAHREWKDANIVRAEQLLADCPAKPRGWEWHYVYHLCHADLFTLKGHTHFVRSVAFSPDGKRLASAAADGTVKVWDAATGQEALTLHGHTRGVRSVAFSPDGKRLASASLDQTVKVWDAATGQEALTLRGHTGNVYSVAFSRDGKRLASASADKTVRVWDVATGQETLSLKGHTSLVWSVAFSPDGKRLASAAADGTVKVWDAATGQQARTLTGHTGLVYGVAFSVNSVAFSPDGQWLASAAADGTVKVWDAATGQEALTLKGHTGPVMSVAFSPDGKRLASASVDRTVKVWDAPTGQEVLTLKGHTGVVSSVAFSPDGKRLASASYDKTIRVWDTDTGQRVLTLKGHTNGVDQVAFSPDGQRLASASGVPYGPTKPGEVKVWDAARGQEALTLQGHTGPVSSVAFSPDGKHLASASADETVKVWDLARGRQARTLQGHTGPVSSVAFSPDGKRLASASGAQMASPSVDRTVKVWDAATGQQLLTLKGHTSSVACVAFSPDGKRLASASVDQTVKVWDAATGQETLTLKGHTSSVMSVAFSPDCQRLASASLDETVKVWDAARGQEVLALQGHTGSAADVAFSPDGKRIASCGMVWDASPRKVIGQPGR